MVRAHARGRHGQSLHAVHDSRRLHAVAAGTRDEMGGPVRKHVGRPWDAGAGYEPHPQSAGNPSAACTLRHQRHQHVLLRGAARRDLTTVMRPLFAILTLATVIACASAGNPTVSSQRLAAEGSYEFFASVAGQHVRGILRVGADTMIVAEVAGAGCLPSAWIRQEQRDPHVFYYGCTGLLITFDRRDLVQLSKWSSSIPVQKRREVCTERVLRNGREVCSRTSIQTYETTESRSGTLQVKRASP